jgi:hypothetical protein
VKGLDRLLGGVERVISTVKSGVDKVIDSVIGSGVRYAEEKLAALNKQWRGNFLKTICFDAVFIAVAAASIIVRAHWTLPVLYVIGAAKLLWTFWRAVRLYGALRPHKEVIDKGIRENDHSLILAGLGSLADIVKDSPFGNLQRFSAQFDANALPPI